MKTSIDWIYSAGGPLILVPVEIAAHWRGVEGWYPPEEGIDPADEPSSDYARACGIDGFLGMLAVGPGRALILGDEPMQTAFITSPAGGIVVRWMHAKDEGSVLRAVDAVPESVWESTPHRLDVGHEGILIFDSAHTGDALPDLSGHGATPEWLRIALSSGIYLVDTAEYRPDSSTRLILHRFRKR